MGLMFSSLKVREFRVYWLGMFVSLIGTWIQIVAQSWLVFKLTNSALLLGLVGFLGSMPMFLLSLFGGILADRVNKKKLLIFTQIAFMFLAFLLAILTQAKLITPTQIIIIAVLNGVVMSFDAPSRQAVVAELVGKQHLMNAIALNSVAFNSTRIIGPALCGILVAGIGLAGCFYINGISFLASIIALLSIKLNHNREEAKNTSTLQDLRESFDIIRTNRLVRALISIVAVSSLFGISYNILMPVFAEHLSVGVRGLGMLMSSSGLGALIAALALAGLGDFKRKGRLLVISLFVFCVSLVMFAASRNYTLALIYLAFTGASSVTAMALINTLLQAIASDRIRGRVFGLFMFTFAGVMPFGSLFAGALSQAIGVAPAIMLGGFICGIFFLAITILYPDIRKI